MNEFLPREVHDGLDDARRQAQRQRSCVYIDVGGVRFAVLRIWDTGFAVSPADAQQMRGLVDLYDGTEHLGRCLVQASGEDGESGAQAFEFKRRARPADRAALDFASDEPAVAVPAERWISG